MSRRRPPSARPGAPGTAPGLAWITGLCAAYALGLALAHRAQALPLWALGILLTVNLMTAAAYALDKQAARRGARRISERALHLWALAGGWPAAWMAQQGLRHKSAKPSFRRIYWVTVLMHCAAAGVWLWWRLGVA